MEGGTNKRKKWKEKKKLDTIQLNRDIRRECIKRLIEKRDETKVKLRKLKRTKWSAGKKTKYV